MKSNYAEALRFPIKLGMTIRDNDDAIIFLQLPA
jgi:hypothetical protein